MSEERILANPLTTGDLEAAIYLCLMLAALTDIDGQPLGSGDYVRREHHRRRSCFEGALEGMKKGISSLSELGLAAEDCEWAASQAYLVRDREGWQSRFQAAESGLREARLSA